jgi:glycosyltransferase involved in cell wall biosynthesis
MTISDQPAALREPMPGTCDDALFAPTRESWSHVSWQTETPAAGLPQRIAIASVHGDPLNPRTWSGAPYNVATGLTQAGFSVVGIDTRFNRMRQATFAAAHLMQGLGRPSSTEKLNRGLAPRAYRARLVADAVRRQAIGRVIHMGTLDLPLLGVDDGAVHYLFCDQTWDLSLRYRPDRADYPEAALLMYEALERESLAGMRHIFTFGDYVRHNLVDHYGIPAARVTAVGSGMGNIPPYAGPKNYEHGHLLFVAKHLFRAKGGDLALEAFQRARLHRPDLRFVMVGNDLPRAVLRHAENVLVYPHISWERLEALYHGAALLVQPMLNDPWGQVYLEALNTRTPVIGLSRNGLPEITENGKHGFLIDKPDPETLAQTILRAVSDPDRLACMGTTGQLHVVRNYSWEFVVAKIAEVLERTGGDRRTAS